jgi:phosphate:Na+ symporter
MLLLIPFTNHIAALMKKLVPETEKKSDIVYEQRLIYIDNQSKSTPTLSVVNAHMEVCRAWKIANENLNIAMEAFFEKNEEKANMVIGYEQIVDYLHRSITPALVEIIHMKLTADDAKRVGDMFVVLSEVEQIGDHAENIAEYTLDVIENDATFTEDAISELQLVKTDTLEMMNMALESYEKQEKTKLQDIKALEKKIDKQTIEFYERHFLRLKDKLCKPEGGIFFTDILSDLENSADCAERIILL